MTELVSVRQFAKLDGCSHTLVQKAIREGKLPVSEDGKLDPGLAGSGWRKQNRRGNPGGNSRGNSAKVATRRRAPASVPPEAPIGTGDDADRVDDLTELAVTLGDSDFVAEVLAGRFVPTIFAEMAKENGLAAKHLLAARKEAGDVVDIEVAEAVLFEQARQIRDAWMNWPVRVGPLIAAELGLAVDPVVEALNKHVQQQLQDQGEPDVEFAEEQAGTA